MSLAQLSGKVALITGKYFSYLSIRFHQLCMLLNILGSSSGIGAAAAVLFAKLGASVSLTGRNQLALDETKSKCTTVAQNSTNQRIVAIKADVTNEQDATDLVTRTISEFGQIDILVNAAGIIEYGSIENTSLESYDRVMNANVRAIYHLMMLTTPHLIKTKGEL